jgi:hypothetical protein
MASVALDQFEYGLTDTLEIEVVDPDAAGTLTALVSSDTEQGNELVTLTGGQGIYRGRLPLDPGAAVHGDGRLAVTTGDQIRVSYQDAPPADPLVTTARIRVQAPVIRDVHAVALGAHQVLVRWNTDRPATSRVRFSAGGPLQTVTDSAGHSTSHAVLLRGLEPRTTYRYDVESVSADGDVSRDSLGGEHRAFTTRPAGTLALLMDDPSASVLETWNNAFQALGWDVDIYPAAMNDPPLVGDRTAGLRSYDAVMWQLDPDRYPPLTDAQRTAVDSLLEGGGRLLLTGHDIGFGLSDAGAPSYTPEREAWLESSLKSRYYIDNLYADTLTGVAGDPVSGAYADSLYITWYMYPDTGDNFGPAPGTDGVWTGVWTENYFKKHFMGMRWESHLPLGVPGSGVWGGEKTRLVCMFHEWRALGGPSTAHLPDRTGALHDAVAWLVGHRPPQARITSPKAGSTLSYHFLPVWFSASLDAGRAVATRELEYSLDGGESWAPAPVAAWNDSMAVWDLASANGGPPVGNSARAMLRLHITDDGSPPLRTVATTGTFTLTRWSGDTRGPALIAGSASCSPAPLRPDRAATLFATFSDAETGAARVTAAEYSIGPEPAAPGAGTRMTGNFEQVTVQAQAELATEGLPAGTLTIWVRGLDENSNWSEASAIGVMNSAAGTGASALDAEQAVKVDFLGPVTPNPFRGRATLRFGLAREGDVKLELFDVSGRVIRTLANGRHSPGVHVLTWDGHDREGNVAPAGIYFLRLHTPTRTFRSRVVSLR